jgi:RNA polymerase sigma-70 factor (ECF subfamily)
MDSTDHDISGHHCRLLYLKALRLTRDAELARDLVQDTLERYLRLRPPGLPPDRVLAWLNTVMRHLFLDYVRSPESRWTSLGDEDVQEDGVASGDGADAAPAWTFVEVKDVAGAVQNLPDRLRRTYEMHVFEKMSYGHIARSMKTTTGTVGTRLHRARHHLRVALLPLIVRSSQGA